MAEKIKKARARRLADPDAYRPCGTCDRCKYSAGRDTNPRATDCYDDMLTAALQPTRRSA